MFIFAVEVPSLFGANVCKTVPDVPPHIESALAELEKAQEDLNEAVEESVEERAAIREFDGGEDRDTAEREACDAMHVFDVHVTMPGERAPRWVTMLAPGCNLAQAQLAAEIQFTASRVIRVREHKPERIEKC